jgi:hypothetical protein
MILPCWTNRRTRLFDLAIIASGMAPHGSRNFSKISIKLISLSSPRVITGRDYIDHSVRIVFGQKENTDDRSTLPTF